MRKSEINPIANTTITPTTTSDYYVGQLRTVRVQETLKITVNSNPIITTTDASICEGDSIDLQSFQ